MLKSELSPGAGLSFLLEMFPLISPVDPSFLRQSSPPSPLQCPPQPQVGRHHIMEAEARPELSISLVEVKQEVEEDGDSDKEDLIIHQVLSEHDYVFVKREADYDTATTFKTEQPSIEQFTHERLEEDDDDMEEDDDDDEEEDDDDKIQAAKTLAELSILPVRLGQQNSLELPDLRRTSQSVLSPAGAQKYSCNICGKQYSTSSNLARHRQTHRSPDHSKARRCHLCNKVRHCIENCPTHFDFYLFFSF